MVSEANAEESAIKFALRAVAGTATHPLELVKFLIQIGHEPVPPQPTTTLFGRPALALPNVFQYIQHIKRVDGLSGCYRGLILKLISQGVCVYAFNCTSAVLKVHDIYHDDTRERVRNAEMTEDGEGEDSEKETEELEEMYAEAAIYDENLPMNERRLRFLHRLGVKLTCRSVAIIVSHPFQVAAFRAMAQFVGRETKYDGVMGAIVGVYRENGITGFFSGLTPRLLAEVCAISMTASIFYVLRTYVLPDNYLTCTSINAIISFAAATLTYPFHVVSSCMTIKGSSLKAASPPCMPSSYTTWIGCWRLLKAEGQIMRGSSLLWRYYTGPQVVIGKRVIPLEPFKKAY